MEQPRDIVIDLSDILRRLGVDPDKVRENMGPIAKAYDTVLEDHCPLDTATRLGLDQESFLPEIKSIVDYVIIDCALHERKSETTFIALVLSGVFAGLQMAKDRGEQAGPPYD